MRILTQVLALLLILTVGGVFEALELVGVEHAACAACAKGECPDCPDCAACPGSNPAISQPEGPTINSETRPPLPTGSDDPVVASGLSSIFHPPKPCSLFSA